MDVDVTTVTSLGSTNQMRGGTNAGLNLQREPLQKNTGGNSEKGTVCIYVYLRVTGRYKLFSQ